MYNVALRNARVCFECKCTWFCKMCNSMSIGKIAFFDIEVNVSSLNIEKLGLVIDYVKVTETSVEKINDIFSEY